MRLRPRAHTVAHWSAIVGLFPLVGAGLGMTTDWAPVGQETTLADLYVAILAIVGVVTLTEVFLLEVNLHRNVRAVWPRRLYVGGVLSGARASIAAVVFLLAHAPVAGPYLQQAPVPIADASIAVMVAFGALSVITTGIGSVIDVRAHGH